MNGVCAFCRVHSARSFRSMVRVHSRAVFTWVPPDAGPARPRAVRHAAIPGIAVGAAVGAEPRSDDGQAIPVAVNSMTDDSALPLSTSWDRQAPGICRAELVAGMPCQSTRVSDPGCPVPELRVEMAWVNGADAPVVVMSPRMLLTRKPMPSK